MSRLVGVMGSVFFFILFVAIGILVYGYAISLLNMKDVVIFSGPIVILIMGIPIILYSCFIMIISFSFGQKSTCFNIIMKYSKFVTRGLLYLCMAGLFISFPVSFAVNIYLLDNGYETCGKISWMSPTTYVKDLSLCDR